MPLDSSLFLFNVLTLLSISSKSFSFHSVLFSIPTAPTAPMQKYLSKPQPPQGPRLLEKLAKVRYKFKATK
jgi:hypothetical protein